jgi:hypothetical protein
VRLRLRRSKQEEGRKEAKEGITSSASPFIFFFLIDPVVRLNASGLKSSGLVIFTWLSMT